MTPEPRPVKSSPPHVTVQVTRHFSAPAERVFDAWLDPALIGRWMFGKAVRDEEIVRLTVDPRIGGRFSFVVRRDGQDLDHVGEYLEIERPRRLVFTWGVGDLATADVSRVAIDIQPREAACDLTLTHQLHPDWAAYASRTEEGWKKMVEALAAALG